ncbi:hypothetical protein DFJ74DRAFT_653322 [Hyaloraphidium curvatum]|nr:hypothetical protein DFJ74DRAFT_653322 [Hyaloraphidium curvatum]
MGCEPLTRGADSMAVTLLECTMSEQWYPQWYLVGPLLYLRPSAANNVDFETVLLAFLAVRNVATCHPPRTVFRDPAELSRAEAEEDGSRACLANTLRIWDIVDEVISMLREKPNQPTPVKPRVRRRKRASSDNSSDDDLPIPKPRDYFAERPKEAELTDEIRRELARCILQTLVFILQRDIVTQEADVRETFLYRSFKQVENISRRAGAALSELLRLGAGDDESPQTLKLALEFVGLVGPRLYITDVGLPCSDWPGFGPCAHPRLPGPPLPRADILRYRIPGAHL